MARIIHNPKIYMPTFIEGFPALSLPRHGIVTVQIILAKFPWGRSEFAYVETAASKTSGQTEAHGMQSLFKKKAGDVLFFEANYVTPKDGILWYRVVMSSWRGRWLKCQLPKRPDNAFEIST